MTICTEGRKRGLDKASEGHKLLENVQQMEVSGDWNLICATIMPDHIHMLITLGTRLPLSRCISKFKSLTRCHLSERLLAWQGNYFDHRLRQPEMIEGFAKYIFLNPYRRGLIGCREVWPWWRLSSDFRPGFIDMLVDGKYPQRAWLKNNPSVFRLIEEDSVPPEKPRTSD